MIMAAKEPAHPNARPWERLANESPIAYAAFVTYRELPIAKRNMARVAEVREKGKKGRSKRVRPGTVDPHVRKWFKAYHWEDRAAAYDHELSEARLRARLRHEESKELKRARQLDQQEEETLVAAQQMKLKAFEMLGWSLSQVTRETTTTSEDGKTVHVHQTIEPTKWSIRDAAYLIRVARELEDVVFYPNRPTVLVPEQPVEVIVERGERAEAMEKLEAFRARMRARMITVSEQPPGSAGAPLDVTGSAAGGIPGGPQGLQAERGADGTPGAGPNGHGPGRGPNGHA